MLNLSFSRLKIASGNSLPRGFFIFMRVYEIIGFRNDDDKINSFGFYLHKLKAKKELLKKIVQLNISANSLENRDIYGERMFEIYLRVNSFNFISNYYNYCIREVEVIE